MKTLIQEQFAFANPEIKKLNGYENLNYLVQNEGKRYVFKTYSENQELLDFVSAEVEVLRNIDFDSEKIPAPIPFSDGDFVKLLDIDGKTKICRMLTYLEGQLLGDADHTEKLFNDFGTFLAALDSQLSGINNYMIKSRQWAWDLQYNHLNKKLISAIDDPKDRSTVTYFFQQFEENVVPKFLDLRKQVIHNDANEWNVLVHDNEIAGIIDFGDLVHTYLINELAVALPYACYEKEDPLKWAQYIIKGYHKIVPLQEIELSVLYYSMAARMCCSVCNAAHSKKIDPKNTYAYSSAKPIWKLMYQWLAISPIRAENAFREAIDLPPLPTKMTRQVEERRNESISSIFSLSYAKPIYMDRSAFQYMYDTSGHTYLDAYNNIPHVGHSHPRVVEAGQRQMAKLNTNTRYLYDQLNDYAEKLLDHFPKSLNRVYFVNSGSAATDLAIRSANAHTGNEQLMVIEHGYHGNTQNAIDASEYKFNNPRGQGRKEHILITQIPDTYRGKYTNNDGSAGKSYAQEAIIQIRDSESPISAFISEPIVGCGGQVPLAKGYLKEIYPEIREQGGVCISDEVQTGFGRLGDYLWGYEMQGVVPDMVILGKPMANGHPMGAVVTTSEIAESFGKGVEFFSSFGGNPVSCAIGLSVLEVIEEEALQQNAKEVGDYYQLLFRKLAESHPCIGDVRGSGLFIGVEIVKDRETKEPDTELASFIKNEMRNRHILIGTDGSNDSILKTKPPLCFTKKNARRVVDMIEDILNLNYALERQRSPLGVML